MTRLVYKSKGSWENTKNWLDKGLNENNFLNTLNQIGEEGVKALEKATPKRTGLTSQSWTYVIERSSQGYTIYWTNSNKTKKGDLIASLLQYGHGTGRGGYVVGIDYINPALRPVFDKFSDEIGKVVMG